MGDRPGPRAAIDRVRARVGPDLLRVLEEDLSPSELTTLLMSVAAARAAQVTPARLMSNWETNRFTWVANADPREVALVEHRLWELLPSDFAGVGLSPIAPLGVSSALAGVDQNRVLSILRAAEVVSDATNVLALEAAHRRKADGQAAIHLAACHRLLRAQAFASETASAHFRLFSLVSSARDRGSGRTEAELMTAHLGCWAQVLVDFGAPGRGRFEYTVFRSGAAAERLLDQVLPSLADTGIAVQERPLRSGAAYYGDLAIKIMYRTASEDLELGDGGLTPWTATLMGDAKERCFISCLATERLASLRTKPSSR